MKKLTLDLDALCIESFEPDESAKTLRGTVQGAESTDGAGCPQSYPFHCLPQPTRGCA